MMTTGGLRYSTFVTLPPSHFYHIIPALGLNESTITLEGRIAAPPVIQPEHTTFEVAVSTLHLPDQSRTTQGNLRIRVYAALSLRRGDLLQATGRLRLAGPRRNPADFDYGAYLKRKGLYGALSVYEPEDILVLGHDLRLYERLLERVRGYVREAIAERLPQPNTHPLLLALLLGDRTGLSAETRSWFSQTGLIHLLAISGLHVFLVGMLVYRLIRPMLLRMGLLWHTVEITRATLTLGLLGLYILLTGAPASAVRAGVMAAVFVAGPPLRRSTNALNALGLAGWVLLMARPTFLFDPGFQLSFSAVFGLLKVYPVLRDWCPEVLLRRPLLKWTTESVLVSLSATLATMPALLYWFGQVAWAGLLLNLAAIPLSGGLLCSGLLTVATHGWCTPLAEAWGGAAATCTTLLLHIAQTGATGASWMVQQGYIREGWKLLSLVLGLVTLASWPMPRIRWKMVSGTLTIPVLGLWVLLAQGLYAPGLEVVFFDVGQGDAALVMLPNRKTLLIDAGGMGLYSDQGSRTVLPHLKRYNIDHLDAIVLSHPHSDHIGGVPALLRHVDVGRIIDNGQSYDSSLYREVYHLADSLSIKVHSVTAGDTLQMDPSVQIQILYPFPDLPPETDPNDASVVLRIQYGQTALLFMGDAEQAAETELVERYPPELLRSDVVKVGHHGSNTSSTPDLVNRTTHNVFGLAVVSVAARNKYGLPNAEILRRWAAQNRRIFQTQSAGAIWLRTDGYQIHQVEWR